MAFSFPKFLIVACDQREEQLKIDVDRSVVTLSRNSTFKDLSLTFTMSLS